MALKLELKAGDIVRMTGEIRIVVRRTAQGKCVLTIAAPQNVVIEHDKIKWTQGSPQAVGDTGLKDGPAEAGEGGVDTASSPAAASAV